MWFSMIAVAVNIAGSLMLFPFYGHVGLAAATSLSAWINVILLAATLWRRDAFRPSPATLRRSGLIVFAGLIMGAALWVLQVTLAPWLDGPLLVRLATVLGIIAAAAIVYFGIVIATGALDGRQIAGMLRRRKG